MFKVVKSSLGYVRLYVRLSDSCEFAFRVVIAGLKECDLEPTGPLFTITITVYTILACVQII